MNDAIAKIIAEAKDRAQLAVDEELFARLVIKECLKICDDVQESYLQQRLDTFDFAEKNRLAAGSSAADTIKKMIEGKFQ